MSSEVAIQLSVANHVKYVGYMVSITDAESVGLILSACGRGERKEQRSQNSPVGAIKSRGDSTDLGVTHNNGI